MHRYKVEPYVAAADVYAVPPHTGRGGWTWYTGSAGWMYRVALESILGFSVREGRLYIDPCVPQSWPGYTIRYRHGSTRYAIEVENPNGVCRAVERMELDGKLVDGNSFALIDDGAEHTVRVRLGQTRQLA